MSAAGCAVLGSGTPATSAASVSPLEKAKLQSLAFMERYNAQYRDAESLAALVTAGKASPAQAEVYRVKRDLLVKVKPLIEAFDAIVARGAVPGAGREQEINDLLNRIAASVT